MVDLMRFKIFYFTFSLALILPGLYFLVTSGLKLGIDFTGGTLFEYQLERTATAEEVKVALSNVIEVGSVTSTQNNTFIIKTKHLEQDQIKKIQERLAQDFGNLESRRVEIVGPVIGEELTRKAIIALLFSFIAIILYIAFSFRKVPKPASSWKFGVTAIIALVHDILIVVGVFAIFGHFLKVEVDTLFVTALLTIIGFSVHDTIVVFDRVRENLAKNIGRKFTEIVNISVVQTLGRSLNTSLTVVFVLTALLLFGGESLRWFTVALLIGIISGTYSSIFNATALLTLWEEKLGH